MEYLKLQAAHIEREKKKENEQFKKIQDSKDYFNKYLAAFRAHRLETAELME